MHHFLKEDFDALLASINGVGDQVKSIGIDMGESCREGAETFHDNFVHEEGSRQQKMLSQRYRELTRIKENATIVTVSADNSHVGIGKKVKLRNLTDGSIDEITIGSYMVLSPNSEAISYRTPLARLILGATKGERRVGNVGDRRVSYEIEEIS